MIRTHPLDATFSPASGELRLSSGAVHLWRVWLRDIPEAVHEVLDANERSRADRFRFDNDRRRFISARGTLRHILAQYTNTAPHDLRFSVGKYGKPALSGDRNPLEFNLSHSGEMMLLATAYGLQVGVDVERVRDNFDFQMLIEQYFPPSIAQGIRHLPLSERTTAFFQLWTHTEAILKAAGVGLSNGVHIDEPNRWTVHSLAPAPGYCAALATETKRAEISYWTWPR